MQFEPKDYRNTGFGESLHDSLQKLAAGIGGQLQQRRQRQDNALGLMALGIPEQQAQLMSGMEPGIQQVGLKQKLLEPSRKSTYELWREMNGQGGNTNNSQGGLASSMGMNGTSSNGQQGTMSSGQPNPSPNQSNMQFPEGGQLSEQGFNALMQEKNQRANRALKESEGEKNRELKLNLANKAIIAETYKSSEKEAQGISKVLDTAQKDIRDLNVLKSLNKSGKLIQGAEKAMVEKFGFGGIYINSATNLADKLIAGMNTRQISGMTVGGKFTNGMPKSVQDKILSLYLTQDGMDSVIENKKLDLQGVEAINKSQIAIRKEYRQQGKALPEDWREQAKAGVQPFLDRNGEKMLDNMWRTYYKQAGVNNPKEINIDFPPEKYIEGKHLSWRGITHELVKGKWLPAPGWKKGDPQFYEQQQIEGE